MFHILLDIHTILCIDDGQTKTLLQTIFTNSLSIITTVYSTNIAFDGDNRNFCLILITMIIEKTLTCPFSIIIFNLFSCQSEFKLILHTPHICHDAYFYSKIFKNLKKSLTIHKNSIWNLNV